MRLPTYMVVLLGWLVKCTFSSSPDYLNCYPVTVTMCSSAVDSLALKRNGSTTANNTPFHRKSKGKRNVDDIELVEWSYNSTVYPSFADDKSADDVKISLSHLHPLVATKCSKYIKLFLCSVHSPVCTPRGVVPPCRELCEVVRSDCLHVAEMFNLEWPEISNCKVFPQFKPSNDCNSPPASNNVVDESEIDWTLVQRISSISWAEALLGDGQVSDMGYYL